MEELLKSPLMSSRYECTHMAAIKQIKIGMNRRHDREDALKVQ